MSQFPLYSQGGAPSQLDLQSGVAANILDYPGRAIDNIIRGRMGALGISPGKMSPEDRKSIGDRLKAEVGDNPILGGLIEVAMNPWVWLMGAFSVAVPGASLLKSAMPHIRHSEFVTKHAPLLSAFYTADEILARGDFIPIVEAAGEAMNRFDVDLTSLHNVEQVRLNMLRKLRDKGFPMRRLGDPNNEFSQKLDAAIQAKLHGLDTARTETRMLITKTKGDVPIEMKLHEVGADAILEGRKLDAFLNEHGGMELVDAMRKYYDESFDALFKTNGVIDDNKITRVVRGMTRNIDGRQVDRLTGTPISDLFDRDTMLWLSEGDAGVKAIKQEQFGKFVRNMIQKKDYYAPTNTSKIYLKELDRGVARQIQPDEYHRVFEGKHAPSGKQRGRFGAIMERTAAPNTFDPEEMLLLRDFENKNFSKALSQNRKIVEHRSKEIAETGTFGMPSLSAERSFHKYRDQAKISYGFDVAQPSDFVMRRQAQARADMLKAIDDPTIDFVQDDLDKVLRSQGAHYDVALGKKGVGRSIMEVAEHGDDAPPGGFSNYDTMRASYSFIRSDKTREYVRDIFLPTFTGKLSVRTGALTASINRTKDGMLTFLDGPVMQAVIEKGGAPAKILKPLRDWASAPVLSGMGAERAVANFFYASTLGVNPASVMLNLTQPLVTLPRRLSFADTANGYWHAINEMSTYFVERTKHFAKHGMTRRGLLLGPEHEQEKFALVKKAFRYAEEAEIGPDIRAQLDGMRSPIAKSLRVGVLGKLEDVQQFVLKTFEKGEWMNRSVTAHATASAARRQGTKNFFKAGGELADEGKFAVRQMVRQTQFSADVMNTPKIFMDPKNPMSNPLLRQFLTFPTRMVTGLFRGTTLGEGSIRSAWVTKNPQLALIRARDGVRALGVSAVMYEVGKELFGVNLAPATILGATMGIYRDSGPLAPFPAPPAIGLPATAIQALFEQDAEMLKYTLPLMLPGGVAATRTLGLFPKLNFVPFSMVQRTTVDYSQRSPDGRYRVLDMDGRLISWETPLAIAAKAAGMDFGRFRNEGEMIKYLTTIRKEAIELRREFLQAWAKNDSGTMRRVKAEFKDRFGMRLEFNESQLKAFRNSRDVTRVERSLNSLPREFRERLAPVVAEQLGERLGMPPERFAETISVSARNPARVQSPAFSPEQQAIIDDLRREKQATAQQTPQQRQAADAPFAPFTAFGTAAPGGG